MGVDKREKDVPAGQPVSGVTSDKLRKYIAETGDDTSWLGPNGETDRGGRYDKRP